MLTVLVALIVVMLALGMATKSLNDAARGANWLTRQVKRLDAWLAKKQAEQRRR